MPSTANQRTKRRRAKRRKELLQNKEDDALYRESQLDPNTVEGQSILPIERVCAYVQQPKNVTLQTRCTIS